MRATSSRLEKALKADGDLKLVVYMMAGHPNRKKSVEVAKRLAASGVAAIEIGVPHSDPLADGPVIQAATYCAHTEDNLIFHGNPALSYDGLLTVPGHLSIPLADEE